MYSPVVVGLMVDFVRLDQLCVMNEDEAVLKIFGGECKEILEIPPNELKEWKRRNTRIDAGSSQADRRLFFLHLFVSFGNTNQLQRLLDKWGYRESINRILRWHTGDNTLLIEGSILGRDEIVSLLIEFGANINYANPKGWTALHTAIFYNHLMVVKILLENDVNCSTVTSEGYNVLDLAERIERKGSNEKMKQKAIEKMLRRKIRETERKRPQ